MKPAFAPVFASFVTHDLSEPEPPRKTSESFYCYVVDVNFASGMYDGNTQDLSVLGMKQR